MRIPTALLLAIWPACAAALTVDFESAPAGPGCSVQHGTTLTTQGYVFSNALGSNRLLGCDGTDPQVGSNGSHSLIDDSGLSDYVVVESGGARFELTQFDAAELFVNDPSQNATQIAAAGFRNGSVVVQSPVYTLDGVVDGPGGNPDFETFLLPAGFSNLDQVQIGAVTGGVNGHLFLIDNLPEPGARWPLALGAALCFALRGATLSPRPRRRRESGGRGRPVRRATRWRWPARRRWRRAPGRRCRGPRAWHRSSRPGPTTRCPRMRRAVRWG